MAKNFFAPQPRIKLELFGKWDEAIRMTQNLSRDIKESSLKAQLKVANTIMKRVKRHLAANDLNWKPLSKDYLKRREAAGLYGVTLYAHGTYYRSISVWTPGNKNIVLVGVKKGIYTKQLNGKPSKLEVAKIAAVHEFSRGKKVPRRPLWNPTIAELGGTKGIKKIYLNSFIWHLRKAGVPVTEFKNFI